MNRRFLLESLAALLLAPLIPAAAKPQSPQPYTVTIHPSDDDNATIKAAAKDIEAHGGGIIMLASGTFYFDEISLPVAKPHIEITPIPEGDTVVWIKY